MISWFIEGNLKIFFWFLSIYQLTNLLPNIEFIEKLFSKIIKKFFEINCFLLIQSFLSRIIIYKVYFILFWAYKILQIFIATNRKTRQGTNKLKRNSGKGGLILYQRYSQLESFLYDQSPCKMVSFAMQKRTSVIISTVINLIALKIIFKFFLLIPSNKKSENRHFRVPSPKYVINWFRNQGSAIIMSSKTVWRLDFCNPA